MYKLFENEVPWDVMTVPRNEQSFITRRIDKDIKHNFFWVKDIEGNCGLMLHLEKPFLKEIEFPKFKRLKLFFVKDKKSFVILGNKDVNKKSFKVFCHNIIFACSKINDEDNIKLINEVRSTLEKWLTVFEKNHSKKLTLSEQIGLLGELNFIKQYLSKHMKIDEAVLCWQGPRKHDQDFVFSKFLFELKTKLASSKQVLKISSLEQLNKKKSDLFLIQNTLSPTNNDTGISLDQMVDRLLSLLDKNNFVRDFFLGNLVLLGYDFEENKYDKKFIFNDLSVYEVLDDFPKLTSNIVHSAIVHASYNLDINKIENWKIPTSQFEEKVFKI